MDTSCGVKPAFVRSPPLLAPSTNVIVANESNNCFEPSAFFAKAQAVFAISWGLKRAARFCFAISDAIASKSSEDESSAVEKALRGNENRVDEAELASTRFQAKDRHRVTHQAKFEKPWGWNSATRGAASLATAPKSFSCRCASPAAANAQAIFDNP